MIRSFSCRGDIERLEYAAYRRPDPGTDHPLAQVFVDQGKRLGDGNLSFLNRFSDGSHRLCADEADAQILACLIGRNGFADDVLHDHSGKGGWIRRVDHPKLHAGCAANAAGIGHQALGQGDDKLMNAGDLFQCADTRIHKSDIRLQHVLVGGHQQIFFNTADNDRINGMIGSGKEIHCRGAGNGGEVAFCRFEAFIVEDVSKAGVKIILIFRYNGDGSVRLTIIARIGGYGSDGACHGGDGVDVGIRKR